MGRTKRHFRQDFYTFRDGQMSKSLYASLRTLTHCVIVVLFLLNINFFGCHFHVSNVIIIKLENSFEIVFHELTTLDEHGILLKSAKTVLAVMSHSTRKLTYVILFYICFPSYNSVFLGENLCRSYRSYICKMTTWLPFFVLRFSSHKNSQTAQYGMWTPWG